MMGTKKRFVGAVLLVCMMFILLPTNVFAAEIKKVELSFENQQSKKEPDIRIETKNIYVDSIKWAYGFDDLGKGDQNLVTIKVKMANSDYLAKDVTWYITGDGIDIAETLTDGEYRVLKIIYTIQKSNSYNPDRYEHNDSHDHNNSHDHYYRGWREKNGIWYYYKNGEKVTNDWVRENNNMYYFNSKGNMLANVTKKISDSYYHFYPDGTLAKGWYSENGIWYYSSRTTGKQYRNCWLENDSQYSGRYYFDSNGIMVTGWRKFPNNTWYYFDVSGNMQRNSWIPSNNYWCYVGSDGVMYTGWNLINNQWYYFDNDGYMR